MVSELVTFKLDKTFLKEVDETAKESGFSSRTDFIRASLRKNINEEKLREAMIELSKNFGKGKKKITDEDIHRVREEIMKEYSKKFNIPLD
ncbi:ribbon-helix-helix protein, CopG family [Candidatus Woesearchaeota archaeon]|nr:ribbon-helix-helix protein, CopG family [Candidatus Woesearchaeota archaeon]